MNIRWTSQTSDSTYEAVRDRETLRYHLIAIDGLPIPLDGASPVGADLVSARATGGHRAAPLDITYPDTITGDADPLHAADAPA